MTTQDDLIKRSDVIAAITVLYRHDEFSPHIAFYAVNDVQKAIDSVPAAKADERQRNEGVAHLSDCAVHNMPAYPNGECDCGVIYQYREGNKHWIDINGEFRESSYKAMKARGEFATRIVYTAPPQRNEGMAIATVYNIDLTPVLDGKEAGMYCHWFYAKQVIPLNTELFTAPPQPESVKSALEAAIGMIDIAIKFEKEAENFISESEYELNGYLGDKAAEICVNAPPLIARLRALITDKEG